MGEFEEGGSDRGGCIMDVGACKYIEILSLFLLSLVSYKAGGYCTMGICVAVLDLPTRLRFRVTHYSAKSQHARQEPSKQTARFSTHYM